MKKTLILISLVITLSMSIVAQQDTTKYWTKEIKAGLNFSQGYLSNWAAGGTSSINPQVFLFSKFNYAKEKLKWDNSINFVLGYNIIGTSKPLKTDDYFEINSLIGQKINEKVYYSLAFSFKSQTNKGYDYKADSTTPISAFLSPGYVTLGVGVDWVPNKIFSVNIAPVTARGTIVTDQALADQGAFGVKKAEYDANGNITQNGENFRLEFGGKLSAKFDLPIAKNVNLLSKFELFSNYLKNVQNIDVDWQNILTMKVNSWLQATVTARLIYDDDIMITDKNGKTGPRTQFKESTSIGIIYIIK